jgi:hypothetical protein
MRKTAPDRERKTWPAGKKTWPAGKKNRPAGKKNRPVGGFCEKRRGGDVIDLWPAGRVRGVSTFRYRLAQKIKEITKHNTKGLQTRMFVAHRKLLHRTAEKASIAENQYLPAHFQNRAAMRWAHTHSLTHTHKGPTVGAAKHVCRSRQCRTCETN